METSEEVWFSLCRATCYGGDEEVMEEVECPLYLRNSMALGALSFSFYDTITRGLLHIGIERPSG